MDLLYLFVHGLLGILLLWIVVGGILVYVFCSLSMDHNLLCIFVRVLSCLAILSHLF